MVFVYARPDADTSTGSWKNQTGGAALFSAVDETSLDDADYIVSAPNTFNDACKLSLSNVGIAGDPATVRYRYRKNDGGDVAAMGLHVELLQGVVVIAEWDHEDIGTSFVTAEQTLTSPQFNSITDFRDLYLSFTTAGWWLEGASIDLDFQNGRTWDGSAAGTDFTTFLSCSRASTGHAKDSGGTWIAFASNELRITDLGLLVEDARTNYLLNSAAPVTQTTGSLGTGNYTLWVEGTGSALVSAGSATISGAASVTENNPDTFTVTGAGTVTVTITGSLTKFQLENGDFASSFISTTGASATRAADAVTVSGSLNTLLTTLPQSLVIDNGGTPSGNVAANHVHIIGDASDGVPSLVMQGGTSNDAFWSGPGFSSGPSFTLGSSLTWLTGVKVGVAQNSGGISVVGGNGTVVTSAINQVVFPSGVGLGYTVAVLPINGYMRRATFWNSKLADATLQGFTAP